MINYSKTKVITNNEVPLSVARGPQCLYESSKFPARYIKNKHRYGLLGILVSLVVSIIEFKKSIFT